MISRRSLIGGLTLVPAFSAAVRLGAASPPNRLVGLVVGNDHYRSIRSLERAVADARDIATKVRSFGYDVTEAIDADTDAMFKAFEAFREKLTGGGGAAFVYYAGHGLQVNGTNFLIPVDADGSSDERMLETSQPLTSLLEDLAAARPGQAIVMLDACRDNPEVAGLPGAYPGFASVQAPGSFYIGYSAGSGELALDRLGPEDRDPNGVFARYLLANLRPDRPIDEIMRDTRCQVSNAAGEIGHRQHPAIYDQTRFDLRLDGSTEVPSARRNACALGLGRLQKTVVLLIANGNYSPFQPNLASPRSDSRRLEKTFKALGAHTVLLEEAGSGRIQEACATLASGGYERIIVYYAGLGALIHDEGALIVVDPTRGAASASPIPEVDGLECVFVGDLVEFLRPPPGSGQEEAGVRGRSAGPSKPPLPQARLVLLMDFCLESLDFAVKLKRPSVLKTLQGGRDHRYDHVAVITASGLFQYAREDAAGGSVRSVFSIGLDNALARPGLSTGQFAEIVRDEVDAMTKGHQVPALFAIPERRGDPLVQRIPRLASSSKAG